MAVMASAHTPNTWHEGILSQVSTQQRCLAQEGVASDRHGCYSICRRRRPPIRHRRRRRRAHSLTTPAARAPPGLTARSQSPVSELGLRALPKSSV